MRVGNIDRTLDARPDPLFCATFSDIASLPHGTNICLCGDFNCSFSDNYYFTHQGRDVLLEGLAERNMEILTSEQPECIDHIALTRSLVCDHIVKVNEWNHNKRLSDHKGIMVCFD